MFISQKHIQATWEKNKKILIVLPKFTIIYIYK